MAEAAAAALVGEAATATTAATSGLIGTAGSVTAGGLFSTGLTLGSVGLTVGGAMSQAAAMRSQAEWQEFDAGQEELRGEQEANQVRRAMLRTLASNNAGRAASGVAVGGSADDVDAEIMADAERELDVTRANTEARAASTRAAAQNTRGSATSTLLGGVGSAAGSLFDYVDRRGAIG